MKEDNQITIYETEDGKARIEVRFVNENVWLTQKQMAELFDCSIDNVSLHLKNIFAEMELDEKSVVEEYSITAADGKKYKTRILMDKGRISHEVAIALAEKEYEIYRIEQDRQYISDFDKLVEKTRNLQKGISPKKKGETKPS